MEWLSGIFSSAADASRVNPVGVAIMLAAIAAVFMAERIACRFDKPENAKNAIKIVGLILCAGGALLAILG